jgi:hypothetical protein
MFQQIKMYREDYNYTNSGMYYTLKYYYEILENHIIEGGGLGIIPYYYDEASKYFQNKERISKQAEYVNENEKEVNIVSRVSFKIENNQKELDIGGEWEE